ncbi:hypothetical protein DFP72DRAFT_929933 [Ephemerocybe angulata]|uniref:Chromo domain-containing protein n=1 Tax=Ephemerocybe angulata TaxID=980116 RepID=A0A8H6LVE8_9AGAR|nr:hypothetical protein DFP72DRAFT_929933 [Tulosesus angulatus]
MDQIDQQRSSSPTGRAGMAEEEDELAADLELATDNRSPTLLLADEDSQKEEEDVEKQHEGEGVSGFGEGTLADIMTSTPKASRTDSSLMGRPSFDLSSLPPLFQPIPIPSPPARLEVDRSRSRSRSVSETPLEVEDVSGGSGGVQGEEDADMTHTQQLQAQIEFLPPPPSSPSEAWDDEDEDRGDTWGVNEGDADNEEDELVLEEEDATAITTGAEANALSDNDDPHGLFGGENDDDTLGDMAVQATPASQQDKDQIGEVDNQDEPEENLFLPGDEEKDDDDEPPLPPPRKLKPARMPSPSSSSSSSSSEGEGPSKKSWTAPAKKSLPAPDSPVSAPLLIDVSESKGSNSSKKATIAPHTPGRTRKRNQSNASSSTLMLGDLSRSASPAKRKMENSHAASRTLVRTPTRNTTTGSSMWGPSASKISKANSTGSVQKKVVPVKAEDVIEISSSPEPSPRSVVQAQINRRKEKLLEKRKVKEEGAKGKIKEEGPKGTIKEEGVKGKIKVEVNKGKEKEKEKAGSSKGKPTASANTSAGPVIDLTSDVDNDDDDEHGMVPTPTPTPAPDVKAKGKGRLPAKVADADSGSEVSFSSDSDDSVDYVKARPAPKAGVPKPAPTQSRITDRVKSKSARSAAETRVKRPPKRSMTGEDDDDADLRPLKRAREMSSKADTFHPVIKTQKTQKSIATMQPSNRPLTQAKRKERDTDDDEPAPRGRFKKPSSSVASSSRKSEPGTSPTRSLRGRTVDLKAEKVKWPKANQHGTKEFQRELIECDLCKVWYHYGCVDIKENDVRIQGSEEFRCPACKAGVVQSHISEEDKENGKCGRPNCNHGPLKRKEYFVEKIVGRKLNPYGKGHTWLVKWDGWDITAASWVEEDGLGEPARIIKRFEDDAKKEQKGRLLANPMETVLLKEVEESQWVDPGYYK